jgi:hypothetical protein
MVAVVSPQMAVEFILSGVHGLWIEEVRDFDQTNYVVVCSCGWEPLPMVDRIEAEATRDFGCPVGMLLEDSRARRQNRTQR